jgi:hypothetical protein
MKSIHSGASFPTKSIPLVLIAVILLVAITNGCCTKLACMDVDHLNEIFLKNMDSIDISSVCIIAYERGSDFTVVRDSFKVDTVIAPANLTSPYSFVDMNLFEKRIDIKYDYQVFFLKSNRSYKIQEFKTAKDECNECSPAFIKDTYTRLSKYKVNGITKELGYLEIDKLTD